MKPFKSVYGWPLALVLAALAPSACAQTGNETIVEAREALNRKDGPRLAMLRATAAANRHPLAMWVDYWEIGNRLATAQVTEVEAFYARWRGTYVEDRLRNDWLRELGARRDWRSLAADYPRFRMNDDREVTCYALLADHLDGKDVQKAARAAWFSQRDADDGCALLATTLYAAKQFTEADVWHKARLAIDMGRLREARLAAELIGPQVGSQVGEIGDGALRYLAVKASASGRRAQELATLALMRQAAADPNAVAQLLRSRWEAALPRELSARAWAAVGRHAAMKLLPDASSHYQRAIVLLTQTPADIDWTHDTLAWKARAALRANDGAPRWQQVMQAINAMSETEQRDPAWVYWKARALQALAADSSEPEALRAQSREMLSSIAGQMHFYGSLAAEELGQPITLPPAPAPLTLQEREAAAADPGLARALQLIGLGLRSEGVREWNFTLRGMDDRRLLAAAQLACDRQVWDRCINTSDRTRVEIDMAQRFPTPFRRELNRRAREIGLDVAYAYGLIRQESRFITDARSSVGAAGLMQVMPATARWTARKIGLPFTQDMINDRDTNLALGTGYLKLVLNDFGGSQPLAAAAYNAGPSRSRRWREGPMLDAAIWAENIPFSETRDYVKKVLSNATFYAALLADPAATQAPSLRARLGRVIGPREGVLPPPDRDLP